MARTTHDYPGKVTTGPAGQPLELHAAPGDIVRLWLNREAFQPNACESILETMLRPDPGIRRRRGIRHAYRFLGLHRERKAGVEYLCMSFCVERGQVARGL